MHSVIIRKAEAAGELAAEIGLQAAMLADETEGTGKPSPHLVRCLRLLTEALVRLNGARAALTAAGAAPEAPSPTAPEVS